TVELSVALVGELSLHPNIVGIKDSTGDARSLEALAAVCDPSCAVLVGSGDALYAALGAGAGGGILAVALLAPAECAGLYRAHRAGRMAEAGHLQKPLTLLHREIVGAHGVAGVKAALDIMGMEGGEPRAPLRALRPDEWESVAQALRKAGILGSVEVPGG
nr:dihydrodipicolinate synthase family protein [Gemmatimonadota bacterium]